MQQNGIEGEGEGGPGEEEGQGEREKVGGPGKRGRGRASPPAARHPSSPSPAIPLPGPLYRRLGGRVVYSVEDLRAFDVRGAFLVAPPSEKVLATLDEGRWAPIPRERLPWPSLLAASRTDPWASIDESRALAESWGSEFVDAGDAGRIDVASDHGPWPDGLLKLAGLLKRI